MNTVRTILLFPLLLTFCLPPTSAPVMAEQPDTNSLGVKALGLPWIYAVRMRVTLAILKIKDPAAGVLTVRFKVGAAGEVSDVHVDGPAREARLATGMVGALGSVTPSPDHLSHPISVRVRIR